MTTLANRVKPWALDLRSRPLLDYVVILGVVFILSGLGIVMVFSSSMAVTALQDDSPWSRVVRQGVMVVVGFIAMWMGLRVRPQSIRRWSSWLLVAAFALLILVLIPGIGTGKEQWGAQSWIGVGPISIQPSELAKVAIAVWGAAYLADQKTTAPWRENKFVRFTGVGIAMFGLIILQGDLGMGLTIASVIALVLFFSGIPIGYLVVSAVVGVLGLVGVAFSGGFRSSRITVYIDALLGHFDDTRDTAFQSYQGFLSLADGGATGVGVGQSRAKWFYLPEATNDFIFAVVGEELGLWGGAMLILLFGMLGYFGLRAARRNSDQFISLMAATLTTGVVVQAFINVAYVIGLAPVTGIQLPMISSGGTSAVITLASMGLLANCARHEPEAISAMQSYGRLSIDRLLRLPEPLTARPPRRGRQQRQPVTQRRPARPPRPQRQEPPRRVGPAEDRYYRRRS